MLRHLRHAAIGAIYIPQNMFPVFSLFLKYMTCNTVHCRLHSKLLYNLHLFLFLFLALLLSGLKANNIPYSPYR